MLVQFFHTPDALPHTTPTVSKAFTTINRPILLASLKLAVLQLLHYWKNMQTFLITLFKKMQPRVSIIWQFCTSYILQLTAEADSQEQREERKNYICIIQIYYKIRQRNEFMEAYRSGPWLSGTLTVAWYWVGEHQARPGRASQATGRAISE